MRRASEAEPRVLMVPDTSVTPLGQLKLHMGN